MENVGLLKTKIESLKKELDSSDMGYQNHLPEIDFVKELCLIIDFKAPIIELFKKYIEKLDMSKQEPDEEILNEWGSLLELMDDPVTTLCFHAFDRLNISKHLLG